MSVWAKLKGTIETVFQLGLAGPLLKNNSGKIEARDAADAAFVNLRALDPVGSTDVATKNYVDTGTLGGATREIRLPLTNAAAQSSATIIPANANVRRCAISITTPYTAGATIAVGQTGSTSLVMGTTDNNPQAAGVYELSEDVPWGAAALAALVTVAGAPAAGAGVLILEYTTPAV